ncbi:hypothetical protein ACOMHN_061052 [Nucella lapillus]
MLVSFEENELIRLFEDFTANENAEMDTVDMILGLLLTEMDTVDMILGLLLTEMDTVDMILGQWSGIE